MLQKLKVFYTGATNEIYECYNFNKRVQEVGESVDMSVAALRTLPKMCNYKTLADTLIRERIVVGVRDNSLRKKLLQTSDLTLKTCIYICRASECTAKQLRVTQQEDVHSFKRKTDKGFRPKREKSVKESQPDRIRCTF